MLVSDLGELVAAYQEISRLDQLIEAAKSGKINIMVNGAGQGEEMAEAVGKEVVSILRQKRNFIVRSLEKWGITE